ncbi:MAG TPA: hypothetical protein VGB77_13180 [Abditibacteriaceae bacterium]|jgi:hypothetical protein
MQNPNGPFQDLNNPAGHPVTQPVVGMAPAEDNRFRYPNYLVRRQFMKLLGAAFFVEAPSGATVLYANQKAFKLKEDIRLYTGEDKTQEVLTIRARSVLDLGATYDVWDAATGQKIGALRRSGLKSMLKDEWKILDAQDREVGIIEEENMVLALIRRFIDFATFFLPQEYHGKIGNRDVLHFKQRKNPFLMKIEIDFSMDNDGILDRRLGIAAAILMCAIEGKQH